MNGKRVVAILGILLAVGVLTIAALIFFGMRWVKDTTEHFKEAGPAIEAKAKALSKAGLQGCVDGTVDVVADCGQLAIRCSAEQQVIARQCFELVTEPDPTFCDGVPNQTDFLDAALWAQKLCEGRGHKDNQQCIQFFSSTVARYCQDRR